MIRRLIILLLIVGCAPTKQPIKPPIATFYIGMTEEEFNEQNKDKISNVFDPKGDFITKNIGTSNSQGYIDGDDPWSRNAYIYGFKSDTLVMVCRGMLNAFLKKEIDYDKYATPPE